MTTVSPGARTRTLPALLLAALVVLAALLGGCVSTSPSRTVGDRQAGADPLADRQRARIRLELAIGYSQQGQTSVALQEINQALVLDPAYADGYNVRGLIAMQVADTALAEDSFRQALAIAPQDPNTLHNVGWLRCEQGRYSDAEGFFQRALAVPGYAQPARTWMTSGICLQRAGQAEAAERSLLRARALDANDPVTGFHLAQLAEAKGDLTGADAYIRRVNDGSSANAETLWLGIRVDNKLNRRETMAELGARLQRRFPQSREAIAYERGNFND
ncbi:type IV pilus biogenesis/stability protein PilW [Variovorax ginsengisoli]|uniref:Type IV pilus assembly protein PilF n=1 Tax=Variovorax ginsengisoli TaxID=363844 RepID=A0ABT9SF77_9BURK|nr:type IV pilus biogenesis/stability protein PilW [Variovorax ginsengisoli]MDP9903025.1 type IV pilus assembly protein PilF [Variovorax ginsengisoli]